MDSLEEMINIGVKLPLDYSEPAYRGWTKPGPKPYLSESHTRVSIPENQTLDALCGHFRIFQLRQGHRYSTDDILTAWYGTSNCPSASRVVDLGSGIGSVGMIAAWRLPGAQIVTVEAQEESVELARKSVQFNQIDKRYDVRLGDFRNPGILRPDEHFDLVLGSPPYFPTSDGVLPKNPQKAACRFELRGSIEDYCETASKHLAAGGWFVCVFPIVPARQFERVLEAGHQFALTLVRWRPVVLKEKNPPLLGLFAFVKSQDLPKWMKDQRCSWTEPPLIIRGQDGSIHPEYSVIKLSIGFPP